MGAIKHRKRIFGSRNFRNLMALEQLTGWSNSSWQKFESSRGSILSAYMPIYTNAYAESNAISLKKGDKLIISINAEIVSGKPFITVRNTNGFEVLNTYNLMNGSNVFEFIAPEDRTYSILLENSYHHENNFKLPTFSVGLVIPEQTPETPPSQVVSAATILADSNVASNQVDNTTISKASIIPSNILSGTIMGIEKKTLAIYGVIAVAGIIIFRKLFK